MPPTDPYKLLKVDRNTSEAEIEAAYDQMFDRYELRAQKGDPAAISMLERLNEAHDLLLDPERRTLLDGNPSLFSPEKASASKVQPGTTKSSPPSKTVPPAARAPRGGTPSGKDTSNLVLRRREVSPTRTMSPAYSNSRLAYILVAVLAVGLAAALIYLLASRPEAIPEAPKGNVVATVNGVPIYEREFNERVEKDKQTALADPLFAPFFDNFQGITGTRALDVLRYDALDKLINMEVIQQQAKKENKYPGPQQQAELVEQAKAGELRSGESFDAFLRRVGVSAAQYSARVTENFVYTVMAEEHMPRTGSDSERGEGFIRWICDTRKNYDAVVKLSFIVPENQPCTSGLPTDIPLPGLTQGTPVQEVPEPIATAEGPTIPPAQASPTPNGNKPVDQ